MKTLANKNRFIGSSLALFLTVASLAPMPSWAAEPEEGAKTMIEGKLKEQCQEMKDAKEKMSAKMKQQDADLTAKVAAMNAAPEDQKQKLMAELITNLVEQRTAMHEEKAKMEEKMMKHMMGHMEMGKKSMSKCPMMKDMNQKSEGAHSEHHDKSK